MHYHVKQPNDAQWSALVTDSLSAEVNAGRIRWNWRVKIDGEPREWSVLELVEAQIDGTKPSPEALNEANSRNPPLDALCYILLSGQQTGPYTPDQIRAMWTNGQVTADTLYWFEGLKEWFPVKGFCQQSAPQNVTLNETVDGGTILGSYLLAVLLPLFGFFAGIYLVLKKQSGHGVACMALSVATFLLLYSLLVH